MLNYLSFLLSSWVLLSTNSFVLLSVQACDRWKKSLCRLMKINKKIKWTCFRVWMIVFSCVLAIDLLPAMSMLNLLMLGVNYHCYAGQEANISPHHTVTHQLTPHHTSWHHSKHTAWQCTSTPHESQRDTMQHHQVTTNNNTVQYIAPCHTTSQHPIEWTIPWPYVTPYRTLSRTTLQHMMPQLTTPLVHDTTLQWKRSLSSSLPTTTSGDAR